MESHTIEKVDDGSSIILALVCFSFCVLALAVLLFYVRKRYRIYLEIKEISREQLWYPNYQNYRKNLRIKAMIANFIIIIILVEVANNSTIFIDRILLLLDASKSIDYIVYNVRFISKYSFIPILCMFLDVLWLAYLHSQYKYTIMRWTAYIILRIILMNIVYHWVRYDSISNIENHLKLSLNRGLLLFFEVLDLLTYLWYSRRFYRLLKGRELEAKLFISRRKYIENKFVCRHFKIATILVAVPLTIYIFINVFSLFYINYFIVHTIRNSRHEYFSHYFVTWPVTICQLLYRILFTFNYTYLIVVSAYRYWRQKHNLTRINERIQPLVRKYQDQIQGQHHKY